MQTFPSTNNRNTHLLIISGKHLLWLASIATFLLLLLSFEAMGQTPTPTPPLNRPCPTEFIARPLQRVPEIVSVDGKLRGTIILSDEQEWIPNRIPVKPPQDKSGYECSPQHVRMFRELGATPNLASAPKGTLFPGNYALPRPGPTLRARVGDLVQLTFINQIDTLPFGDSIDRAERGRGNGCDETSVYPGKNGDTFPDCFHGSSTGNIHFHGTHTNPNATGDNVFIEVRPSLRVNGKPIVTPESVANSFNQFFRRCEAELDGNVLREWPAKWNDLPNQWTAEQKWLLNLYDEQMRRDYGSGVRPLWRVDEAQLKVGAWPQYYIGAYPYCFRLPEYKEQTWPPPKPAPTMDGMNMPSDDNAALMMGQSPGTHWYHAHKHGSTAINVANGMTGAFIIEGSYDDDLNKWYGANWTRTQKVLVINQLGVSPNKERGGNQRQDKGPDFEVNGQLKPIIDMRPGEVQMWRIVNTSGRAGVYFLGPPGTPVPTITNTDLTTQPPICPKPSVTPADFQWKQLAQDGVQFKDKNYQRPVQPFLMAAGNRVDLLIKAPSTPCAPGANCIYPLVVQNEVDPSDLTSACPLTLLSVQISGKPVDPKSPGGQFIPAAPSFPKFLQDISDDEVSGTKTLTFGPSGPGAKNQKIDGKLFDGDIGEVILLNKVEEWKLANITSGISHPFHIHINPFQVVEVFDPNEVLTDDSGNPVIDPVSKQPVLKYVFQGGIHLIKGQCPLDPFGNPDDWKPCGPRPPNKDNIWWDVFPIPSARSVTAFDMNTKKSVAVTVPGYFKMRSRFVDYPGQYVLHCHILAHEDRGMMNIVEVVPYKTPYSHQ